MSISLATQVILVAFALSLAMSSPLAKRDTHCETNVPLTYYGSDYFPAGDGKWAGDVPPYKPFGTGACDQEPIDKSLYVGVNPKAYAKNVCGMCAKITYNGACVVAPIVDLCPGCGSGSSGLDISLQGFSRLVGGEEKARHVGVIPVNFEVLACPRGVHATGTTAFASSDPCSGASSTPSTSTLATMQALPTSTSIAAPAFEAKTFVCDVKNNTLFGFPCCKAPEKVGSEWKDKNGFNWGFEDGASCIVPKIEKTNATNVSPVTSNIVTGTAPFDKTKCGSDGFLFGFPCCKAPEKVSDEFKDSKGFRYGFEDGKSCIVPLPKKPADTKPEEPEKNKEKQETAKTNADIVTPKQPTSAPSSPSEVVSVSPPAPSPASPQSNKSAPPATPPTSPPPNNPAPPATPPPSPPANNPPPPSTPPPSPPVNNPPPPTGGNSDWTRECLSSHNGFRTQIPVPGLVWDNGLAARSQERAEVNANLGRLVHDDNGNGENLYATWGGDTSCTAAVRGWHDEKSLYPAGRPFGEGNPSDYGHYTQVVWRNTIRVGCAYADRGNARYTVCQYSPAGNVLGQQPF